jgi:hypothetical protein
MKSYSVCVLVAAKGQGFVLSSLSSALHCQILVHRLCGCWVFPVGHCHSDYMDACIAAHQLNPT